MEVTAYLQNRKRKELGELEDRYNVRIVLNGDPSLPPGGGKLDFIKNKDLGFDKENLITVRMSQNMNDQYNSLRTNF